MLKRDYRFSRSYSLTQQNLNMKKPGFDRAAFLLSSKFNYVIKA